MERPPTAGGIFVVIKESLNTEMPMVHVPGCHSKGFLYIYIVPCSREIIVQLPSGLLSSLTYLIVSWSPLASRHMYMNQIRHLSAHKTIDPEKAEYSSCRQHPTMMKRENTGKIPLI